MDDFKINLHLLGEALKQKKDVLEQILNITENQHTVLEARDGGQSNEYFAQMNKEKQRLIDELLNIDEVFQGIFNKISDVFEVRSQGCTREVAWLQTVIKTVCDIDIKIRLQEDKNSRIKEIKKTAVSPKLSKNHIISEYAKNSKYSG